MRPKAIGIAMTCFWMTVLEVIDWGFAGYSWFHSHTVKNGKSNCSLAVVYTYCQRHPLIAKFLTC